MVNIFPLTFIKMVFEFSLTCALLLTNHLHMVFHNHPHFGFFEEEGELALDVWEL